MDVLRDLGSGAAGLRSALLDGCGATRLPGRAVVEAAAIESAASTLVLMLRARVWVGARLALCEGPRATDRGLCVLVVLEGATELLLLGVCEADRAEDWV